jgi:hypothetical protein
VVLQCFLGFFTYARFEWQVYALLKHKPSPRQLGLALAIGAFFSLMSLL